MMMASCSKDYDELIVGKWRITSYEGALAYGDDVDDGSENNNYSSGQIEYVDSWGWVFNADGTGHSYEIVEGRERELVQLSYTITDDSLCIRYNNGCRFDWAIETLNRQKLRVSKRFEITDYEGNFLRYEYGCANYKRQ